MQNNTLRVVVLFGGVSSEHEVSCLSAASVIGNLSKERYAIDRVGITRSGQWLLYAGPDEDIPNGTWAEHPDNKSAFLSPDRSAPGLFVLNGERYERRPADVVFPVLHGKNGEDGTMQGLFQLAGLPFVGCDTLSSAVCMDKGIANTLFEDAGIPQAAFVWFWARDYEIKRKEILNVIERKLHWPVFVKPANAGSSVGVSKAGDADALDRAVALAAKEDKKIVIEETITGAEVEVAVMGNEEPVASTVGEIAPGDEFYSYDDKYKNGVSQLFIPARLPENVLGNVRDCAVRAYRMLGCEGLARVDFFVKPDGTHCLNEINTLPGFTNISMYPKLFMAEGLSYGEILDRLITCALARQS